MDKVEEGLVILAFGVVGKEGERGGIAGKTRRHL